MKMGEDLHFMSLVSKPNTHISHTHSNNRNFIRTEHRANTLTVVTSAVVHLELDAIGMLVVSNFHRRIVDTYLKLLNKYDAVLPYFMDSIIVII